MSYLDNRMWLPHYWTCGSVYEATITLASRVRVRSDPHPQALELAECGHPDPIERTSRCRDEVEEMARIVSVRWLSWKS